ncbi:MAG: hypothetical protein IBX57_06755, partial [Gammaproteobacteria bacterium]|nr:hypothetical protein [Gammaproteobacteria bacterium]
MDMTDPILQMLAYELAALFALLSLWMIWRASKTNKRLRLDADKAVKKLKRRKELRLDSLSTLLADKYGLADAALTQSAQTLQEHEQQLYKTVLSLYVQQDSAKLTAFPDQLEQAVNAALELLPVGHDKQQTSQQHDEVSELKQQVAQTSLKLAELTAQFQSLNPSSEQDTEEVDTSFAEDDDFIDEETDQQESDVPSEGTTDEVNDEVMTSPDENESANETDEAEIDVDEIEVADDQEPVIDAEDTEQIEPQEDIISADDVDALLEGLDVDITNDEIAPDDEFISDGIDLSATDEDESELKKTEAELVAVSADSAETEPEPELQVEPELETTLTMDDVDDVDSLGSSANVETQALEPENIDTLSSSVGNDAVSEQQDINSEHLSNVLADYVTSQWVNTIPDVYGKSTTIEPELEPELE